MCFDRIEHRTKPCSGVCSIEGPRTSEGFRWIKNGEDEQGFHDVDFLQLEPPEGFKV